MKKFLFLSLLTLGLFSVTAQRYTLTVAASEDTLTFGATATGYATLSTAAQNAVAGYKRAVSFEYTGLETVAGTLAATATLEVSAYASGNAWITAPGTSAITLTDVATQYGGWSIAGSWSRYRIKYIVTGGTVSPSGVLVIKP